MQFYALALHSNFDLCSFLSPSLANVACVLHETSRCLEPSPLPFSARKLCSFTVIAPFINTRRPSTTVSVLGIAVPYRLLLPVRQAHVRARDGTRLQPHWAVLEFFHSHA